MMAAFSCDAEKPRAALFPKRGRLDDLTRRDRLPAEQYFTMMSSEVQNETQLTASRVA